MKRKLIIAIKVIAAYFLFIWGFEGSYTNYKKEYRFKYNGLLWVGLDYWSIWKYKSDDTSMKWIEFTRNILPQMQRWAGSLNTKSLFNTLGIFQVLDWCRKWPACIGLGKANWLKAYRHNTLDISGSN